MSTKEEKNTIRVAKKSHETNLAQGMNQGDVNGVDENAAAVVVSPVMQTTQRASNYFNKPVGMDVENGNVSPGQGAEENMISAEVTSQSTGNDQSKHVNSGEKTI